MKAAKLLLLKLLVIILLPLICPHPSQGFTLLPMLVQGLKDLKRDLPRYNENIRMSEATVNAIIDEMDGIKPTTPGEGRTPNERVRDLKQGIKGELSQAKTNYFALTMASDQLTVALDRYTKNQTPDNLNKAQNIVNQINAIRENLNNNLSNAQNLIRQIAMIRLDTDEKEWNNPNGKYQKEHQAIDNLWKWLAATKDQGASGTKVPKAGNWQEIDLDTKETRPIKVSWDGVTLKVQVGKKTYTGTPGLNPTEIEVTHTLKTPAEARIIQGPIPQKVLLQAIAEHDMTCTYTMRVTSPVLLEGTTDSYFQLQWEPRTLKLRTFRREAPHRVQWRALTK
jgi:hypothetical protein